RLFGQQLDRGARGADADEPVSRQCLSVEAKLLGLVLNDEDGRRGRVGHKDSRFTIYAGGATGESCPVPRAGAKEGFSAGSGESRRKVVPLPASVAIP